ncbi:complement C1q tumor necrosis factor-related protein 7-like [Saccostrea echinata]|uniref:complement C1q tumor necrosis factor-related protein 7-like n=1 Tax=Saccostrea echinata TaxID=191078 RepID=UPI002A8000EB|nr:complement C1q tumor necrosis factor-related protein 7-like [Saccostrea echinata]
MFLLLMSLHLTIASMTELTTSKNFTGLEERMSKLEGRLNVTERALGRLLTGRENTNMSFLDVLTLRSGILDDQSTPILFSAYKSFSESDISNKVTIRFDKIYINSGDHYHTEDGIFIAPLTGIYLFHWTIATGGSYFATQLMVGGKPRASNLVPHAGSGGSSSAMVMINVNRAVHVWIQIYGDNEHVFGGSIGVGNNHQSTFSGILLRKT